MNCPQCGLLTWPYDDETATCKQGHHTPVGTVVTSEPVASKRWRVPAWLPGLAVGTAAILLHLL